MTATTIPLLPCTAADATAEFYGALGFDVSDQQTRPYLYMAFTLADIGLHFKEAAPHLDPGDELSGGCLVVVDDVSGYHRDFTDRLRAQYGRVPARGLPRLTRLRPGASRFCLYDPSGNCIVFSNRDEPEVEYGGSSALSGLAKALDNVRIFRDFKNDDILAARALDTAIGRHRDTAPRVDVARALADRVELAVALGNQVGADVARTELDAMDLTPEERELIATELRAIADLQRWLSG
jgi:hypothetical protein